jgi:nucleoside-diphosphate-sugar epimerase
MLLVIGGAGFIGSNVVASLNEARRADIATNDGFGADGKGHKPGKRQAADVAPPHENLRRVGYNAGFTSLADAVVRYVTGFLLGADRCR